MFLRARWSCLIFAEENYLKVKPPNQQLGSVTQEPISFRWLRMSVDRTVPPSCNTIELLSVWNRNRLFKKKLSRGCNELKLLTVKVTVGRKFNQKLAATWNVYFVSEPKTRWLTLTIKDEQHERLKPIWQPQWALEYVMFSGIDGMLNCI